MSKRKRKWFRFPETVKSGRVDVDLSMVGAVSIARRGDLYGCYLNIGGAQAQEFMATIGTVRRLREALDLEP